MRGFVTRVQPAPAMRRGRGRPPRLGLAAAAVAAVPLLAGWGSFGDKGVHIENSYYPLSGLTHQELLKAVRFHGPGGGLDYGLSVIDFFPDYRVETGQGGCRVVSAATGLRVQVHLPEWRDAARPRAPGLAARFIRAVTAHEMHHVAIAKHYALLMTTALARLKPTQNCWDLRRNAEDVIRTVEKRHYDAQRAFDDRSHRQIRRLL